MGIADLIPGVSGGQLLLLRESISNLLMRSLL